MRQGSTVCTHPALRIVAISGRVAAGKTTLAEGIARQRASAVIVKTRQVLERTTAVDTDRFRLQQVGRALDEATDGRWVADAVVKGSSAALVVVVDAIRIEPQLRALRSRGNVQHIHLVATPAVLAARYAAKDEGNTYEAVASDPTEAGVDALAEIADIVLDTSVLDREQTLDAALVQIDRAFASPR